MLPCGSVRCRSFVRGGDSFNGQYLLLLIFIIYLLNLWLCSSRNSRSDFEYICIYSPCVVAVVSIRSVHICICCMLNEFESGHKMWFARKFIFYSSWELWFDHHHHHRGSMDESGKLVRQAGTTYIRLYSRSQHHSQWRNIIITGGTTIAWLIEWICDEDGAAAVELISKSNFRFTFLMYLLPRVTREIVQLTDEATERCLKHEKYTNIQ